MNPIFKFTALLSIVIAIVSCSKDDYKLDSGFDRFVRFNFLVNSNNVPVEYPAINTTSLPVDTFENQSVKVLKIPVTLTSATLKSPVRVNFSSITSGKNNSYSIKPENQLVFEGSKLTDTIFLAFNERWTDKQSIRFQLENASDPDINIGNLNSYAPNTNFTVNLGKISTVYTFPVTQYLIKGEIGETIDFKVNFPNGFIPSEIENASFFTVNNGFDYSLTRDDFGDSRNSVTYHLTILEDIQNDDVRFESKLKLTNIPNYIATGNTTLTIAKPIKSNRDIQANPASNFYDLSNQYYLTYGEHWFDKNGSCAWQKFNAFTFPVVVAADNENAILYTDKGTADPNDDIYHDAFKIGFNVVSGTNTTNSFGLKRWFSGESTAAANSPGFNITSALEFFPENGNSKTQGNVLVIPQDITIAGTNKNTYIIAISGEGTYKEISDGLFEVSFELKLTNDALFGGTVSTQYRIYNNRTYPDLEDLNSGCPKEVAL